MKQLPEVTQQNVHLFIPRKVAYVTAKMQQDDQVLAKQALLSFYNSRTYAQLENEHTKRWQDNPKQLYSDFRQEQ